LGRGLPRPLFFSGNPDNRKVEMRTTFGLAIACCLGLASPAALAAGNDAAGCKDPFLTRMPGYDISRCEAKDFDAHEFKAGKAKAVTVEGRFSETMYGFSGRTEPSRVQIQRNYENAVKAIGGQVVYNDGEGALYLKAARDGKEIWVHVDAYISSQYRVFVVEKAAMAQDVVADAKAFQAGLAAVGHVEVPGILFDTNKADLKPESERAVAEVAKLLKGSPALKVWVVGHTDATGQESANLALSGARAASVVKALVGKHGIDPGRLGSFGAGPYAPIASNASEDGRRKNRRVELVSR
jgi:outer membrane protein OmpA-like peptidoglycan-associated protein